MSAENKFEFKAEIKKLLYILSQSLYQHQEIFLRELISNSSDALKKVHLLNLQKEDLANPELEKEINITIDAKANTLRVIDTGVGMTKEDLINNLGTIAGSGSEKFLNKMKETEEGKNGNALDLDIIGQFGVGFYSCFMVADRVEVNTKSYLKDEPAWKWISDGTGEFEITTSDKNERGTEVIIHFKEEEKNYKAQYEIESVIKKYSNFVPYPIYVEEIKEEEPSAEDKGKKIVDVELDDEEKSSDVKEGEKDGEKEEGKDEEKEEEPTRKPVNEINPLWKRKKSEISDEDYKNFYHFISNKFDNYQHVINYKVDGRIQFHSIMFIPETKSQDLMRPEVEYGLSLYSKNVMIVKNSKEIIPQWMRFVQGMVDSEDIPLNVSRDTIQANRVIMKMETLLVKKFFNEISAIAQNEPDKYLKIWNEFGTFLKEGIVSDHARREKLLPLLRFATSNTKKDELIGLEEYIKNLPEDKTEIYYLVGENIDTMKLSPHLGYYKKEGIDVILFSEVLDNFLMMNVHEYTRTIGEGDDAKDVKYKFTPIDISEKDKSAEESKDKKEGEEETKSDEDADIPEDVKNFLKDVKKILAGKIVDTKVSDKLYDSACRLANPAGGMTSSMQRAMRYWTQSTNGKSFQIPQKIFEFNPEHPIIKALVTLHTKDPKNGKIKPIIMQLFENSLLAEGDLPNPSLIVPRINQLIEMLITGNDDVINPSDEETLEEAESEENGSEEKTSEEEKPKEAESEEEKESKE